MGGQEFSKFGLGIRTHNSQTLRATKKAVLCGRRGIFSRIIFQKTYTTFTGSMNSYYHFPEFESSLLIYLPIQWAMCILVACKHACLAIIILCYVDIIIFYRYCYRNPKDNFSYRTGSYRISSNYCAVVLLCAAILTIHLNSQLAITIRGRRPNYSKDRYIVFIPFIMVCQLH